MFMETGSFGGTLLSDGTFSEVFPARVVISDTEFAMLGLDEHEQPSSLPACFRWCFDRLGPGGTQWLPELTDSSVAIVYFKRLPDAIAFVAQWNACRSADHQTAPGSAPWTQASTFGAATLGMLDEAVDWQDGCPDWPLSISPEMPDRRPPAPPLG